MVQWTKKHPFGTFLLNVLITLLTVGIVTMLLINNYGVKINNIYMNSEIIKDTVTKLKDVENGE